MLRVSGPFPLAAQPGDLARDVVAVPRGLVGPDRHPHHIFCGHGRSPDHLCPGSHAPMCKHLLQQVARGHHPLAQVLAEGICDCEFFDAAERTHCNLGSHMQVAWVLLANSTQFGTSFLSVCGALGTLVLYALWLLATTSESQGSSYSSFGSASASQGNEAPRSRALGELPLPLSGS